MTNTVLESLSPKPSRPGASPSMKALAYDALKEKILTNVFSAGAFIDDAAEAAALHMSKTPIREALLLLEAEGLVEVLPRRGIRVVPISLQDMEDIYYLLTALEVTAVELIAARRPTRAELEPLFRACAAIRASLETCEGNEADEAFHRNILILSGNRHLAETGLRYRERVQRAHLIAMRLLSAENLELSATRHEEMVESLLSSSPKEAVRLHKEQRVRGGKRVLDALRNSGLNAL